MFLLSPWTPSSRATRKNSHFDVVLCGSGKGCSALPLFLCVLAVIKRRPSSSIGQFCFFPLLRHVYTHSPSLSDENRPFAIFINRSFSYFFPPPARPALASFGFGVLYRVMKKFLYYFLPPLAWLLTIRALCCCLYNFFFSKYSFFLYAREKQECCAMGGRYVWCAVLFVCRSTHYAFVLLLYMRRRMKRSPCHRRI